MSTNDGKLIQALARIDEANQDDPNLENIEGHPVPKEVLYAQRMSDWLKKLAPSAPETLQIAAHAQHIRRWEIPRDEYPKGLSGYLAWRNRLYHFHAEETAKLMQTVGYDEEAIQAVKRLLLKNPSQHTPESQTLEDTACLVFIEYYFDEFAKKYTDAKLVDIVRKTWIKMSPAAHEAALSLDHSERAKTIFGQALHLS